MAGNNSKAKRTPEPKGTADQAIGRPGPWGEDRYEQPGQPVDQSVVTPPKTVPNEGDKPASTPVTRRDYGGSEGSPGGDAG